MTAKELYKHDSGFRGFLAVWDQDRRCPLELVDYLLDRGMESQAECARWAATERKRPIYVPLTHYGERTTPCGPYPTMNKVNEWFWSAAFDETASDIPKGYTADECCQCYGTTAIESIVALLDAWVIPVGSLS